MPTSTHKFGGSNQDIDNMAIIVGNMPVDIHPNNLCFGARWISPVTNKPVTALHFSSFIDCIRDLYNRPLYRRLTCQNDSLKKNF